MRQSHRTNVMGLVLLGLVICGACAGPATSATPSTTASPAAAPTPVASAAPIVTPGPSAAGEGIALEVVVDRLDSPVEVTTAGDGTGRIFVVEQGGRIRIVEDDRVVAVPFLDISDRITSGGERGLLGLAFHPDFPTDPRLFVDYTDVRGDTVVASFTVDPATPDRVDAASELVLLTIPQPFGNHNGGAVVFGTDGMLYIAMGDGGSGGDPQGNGQRLDTLLGKILRIDVLGPDAGTSAPYAVPDDNPFVGSADALPEIWLRGLRNPWRIRVDTATGDLWIGDVGQGAWEEIDVIRSGTGGQNLGWNTMEGTHCFSTDPCEMDGLTLPVAEYDHDAGCSIVGGVVARGPAVPGIDGRYLFSDYCSGTIWTIDPTSDALQAPEPIFESGRGISAISLDEDGTVLVTDLNGGQLLRIVSAP